MNLLRNLADLVRCDMAGRGYDVKDVRDNDHGALVLYSRMRRHTIEPRPRRVLKAEGFDCPPQHSLGIKLLEQAVEAGDSLAPYRSKSIGSLAECDGLLDYWRIHHFHLGAKLTEDGFIERTAELLFCLVDDSFAYFIKIATHDSSPWAKKELVEIIHLNWPDFIKTYRLKGITGVSPEYDDSDRKILRAANATTVLDMQDGTFYLEPGLGNTTGGVHITDLRWADHMCRVAEAIEARVNRDWRSIVIDAKRQGYCLRETATLLLMEAVPDLYWVIGDPGSGYRFRQYVRT